MKLRRDKPSPEDAIARLADGSVSEAQRGVLERLVADSPELAAKLSEQRRALELVGAVDVLAPQRLLERLATPASAPTPRPRRRVPLRGIAVLVGAIVVLALLAARNHGPNVSGEIHLALARATLPAPAASPADRGELKASVDGIAFPDWHARGWQASGARADALEGRAVETVFYRSADYGRLGYSIVAGLPLALPSGGRSHGDGAVTYTVFHLDGATVVTWRRYGHTCVLAARRAPASALLALAGWA